MLDGKKILELNGYVQRQLAKQSETGIACVINIKNRENQLNYIQLNKLSIIYLINEKELLKHRMGQ